MGSVLEPKGEELRKAIRWVSDRRRDEPKLPIWKLAEEASVKFDLSPADSEFLRRALSEAKD
jgi:hypothetical protein